MRIVVPSMQRTRDMRTIDQLAEAGLNPLVVVPFKELSAYRFEAHDEADVIAHPSNLKGIARVRQFIMDTVEGESIVMVDDDLSFHTRRKDDPTKFVPATGGELRKLFKTFERHLKSYAHVSMIGRQGGNRFVNGDLECSRPWHVFGFNRALFNKAGVKFGAGLLQDDFDITLQLLRKGYPNRILTGWAVNQHNGHGAPGGAASYRNVEDHNNSIERLAQRHVPYVKVVEREYKGDPWLGRRKESIIYWKKAFASYGEDK